MDFIKVNRGKYRDTMCPYFKDGFVECAGYRDCKRCDIGQRIRRDNVLRHNNYPLFSWRDARRNTEKGRGQNWWHFPIILSEEVMEKLGLEKNLFFQIAIAEGGGGVFHHNPCGEIDCHLFVNPSKKFTIGRHEAYGIPDERAVAKFDELFFMDLHKVIKYAESKIGVWCL